MSVRYTAAKESVIWVLNYIRAQIPFKYLNGRKMIILHNGKKRKENDASCSTSRKICCTDPTRNINHPARGTQSIEQDRPYTANLFLKRKHSGPRVSQPSLNRGTELKTLPSGSNWYFGVTRTLWLMELFIRASIHRKTLIVRVSKTACRVTL